MTFQRLKFIRNFCKNISSNSIYVTTPIFYVNAAPHIGHLYSAVVADAAFRYQRLRYPLKPALFSTGTDEHGIKVAQAAASHGIPVGEYCSKISAEYRKVFDACGVEYSDFVRTTEKRHCRAVHNFWNRLKTKDFIYSSKYSGWYCISDETFLTENQIKLNPDGTRESFESGHRVDWTEEINYMFRLGKVQADVINWIKTGNRIRPAKFEKILLEQLSEQLPDVSVSRPATRMQWGITVPNDDTQKIYVWLDALVNYLTCAGYPDRMVWPPSLQVLGKDILKFHGIYWPAFLIAAGYEPPQQLLVHSHWTVDGEKMSKSKFNVVSPEERSQLYTWEGLRYFLLREGVPHSDGNYSDTKVLRILNSELADTLGNLLSRACAKSLNPRQIFPTIYEEHFGTLIELDATQRLTDLLTTITEKCAAHYDSHNFYMVVDTVMGVLHAANNFFESCKPWELKADVKNNHDPNKNVEKLETIIGITMHTLRICGIILQPIIPNFSTKLLDKVSVPRSERTWFDLGAFSWKNILNEKNTSADLNSENVVLFKRIYLKKDEKSSPSANQIGKRKKSTGM